MRESFFIVATALMILSACRREPSPGDAPLPARPSGALRLIEQSEPRPPLLASELNDTICETWFRIANEGDSEINVTVASKSCSCVDLLADGTSLEVGDGFAMADLPCPGAFSLAVTASGVGDRCRVER